MLFGKKLNTYDLMLIDLLHTALKAWLLTVDSRLSYTVTEIELAGSRRGIHIANGSFEIKEQDRIVTTAKLNVGVPNSTLAVNNPLPLELELVIFCEGAIRTNQEIGEIFSELTFFYTKKDRAWHVRDIRAGGVDSSYDAIRLFLMKKVWELERFA